ncbi:restriction endonuclease subunit S [Mycoplasma sp. 653B]|uniref:restriction endonuclease subunit S n=1 Tax=Mycoplasma sp. 653B TaxID=3401677 RepID=UPI003AAAFCA3
MQKEKLVPAIRFKGFSEEWKDIYLSQVASVITGGEPPKHYSKTFNHKKNFIYPVYSNGYDENALWGYADTYKVDKPSITFSSIGTLGFPTIRLEPYTPIIRLKVILPILNQVDLQYLKYALDQSDFMTNASGIPNMNADQVKQIIINSTDINEQQKIGLFFSGLDSLVRSQEQKLEKLQAIKQSLLNKMFASYDKKMPEIRFKGFNEDWNTDKVCNLFKITRGEVLAQNQISEFQNEIYAYPVYSSQTLKNGLMGYYKEYLFDNCITWTTDGANAGTVKYRNEKFYCTNVCGVLEEGKLKPNDCFAELLNLVTPNHVTRAGNPKLMNSTMGEIIINYPNSTIEYTKISTLFMSIDSLIHSCDQKLKKLNNIKQALLEKMFC